MRLVVKPGAFFNQLQWSRHHWVILLAFLGVATLETLVGKTHAYYEIYASFLVTKLGIGLNPAIAILTFLRLSVILLGSLALASFLWVVGNIFGKSTSKRVLFRRLAVVFTVFLAAYTAQHYAHTGPAIAIVSLALYLWGSVLGYFAMREQFDLNHLEGMVFGLFAFLVVSSAWHYSNHIADAVAKTAAFKAEKKSVPSLSVKPSGHQLQ